MRNTQNNLSSFKEEKTANARKLFDLQELLDRLGITPLQMEKANYVIPLEGMADYEVRQKLKNAWFITSGNFGFNSSLYFLYFILSSGCCLCLFNGDSECFTAYFFDRRYYSLKSNKGEA